MVTVMIERSSEAGCCNRAIHNKHDADEAMFYRQRASAHSTDGLPDTMTLKTEEGTPSRSLTEDGAKSVADVRRTKRKRAAFSDSVAHDTVGVRRAVRAGLRQNVRKPLLVGHPPSIAGGEMTSGSGTGMKVELAVPPPTHPVRQCREQAASSSGWSGKRGDVDFVSSGPGSIGRLCTSPAVPGRMGGFDFSVSEDTEEDSNVKSEALRVLLPKRSIHGE